MKRELSETNKNLEKKSIYLAAAPAARPVRVREGRAEEGAENDGEAREGAPDGAGTVTFNDILEVSVIRQFNFDLSRTPSVTTWTSARR